MSILPTVLELATNDSIGIDDVNSHFMAMTLSTSEVIPSVEGNFALVTYQSVLFIELDGPRQRSLFVQVTGKA